MVLTRGTVINGLRGNYTIEKKELHRGGMGIIHIGRSGNGQVIVVKEPLRKSDGEDAIRLEKLKVEAQILANLDHKNIVKYIDECESGKTFYLIIELVPGEQLKKLVNPSPRVKKPLSEDETIFLSLNLLDAVKYLHERNIIHRDIKPQNIMKNMNIKLIDFGTAKEGYTQLLPHGHTRIYTPGWSAPEQLGGLVTPASDLYAVGTTMFFLLTGNEPRYYQTDEQILLKTPKEINPRVSKDISDIVKKALNKDMSKRYQLADDMIRAIEGKSHIVRAPSIECLGKRYLIKKPIVIGRRHPSDIIIPDQKRFISKRHATIYIDSGRFWIEDMGSSNGTYVQKKGTFKRIKKHELKNNDVIALCYKHNLGPYTTFTFHS